MKENKVENLIWGGFAGIGALFVVIGLAICMFTFNYSNKVETIGTITEISSYIGSDDGSSSHKVYV